MTEKAGVLVAGTITQDYVDAPGLHMEGELGGSAIYFALAARHFAPISVIGAVGQDRENEVRQVLAFADLTRLSVSNKPTYAWHARRAEAGGEATTLRRFGAIQEGYRPRVDSPDSWPDAVFLASVDPQVQLEVANAKQGGLLAADMMDIFIRDNREQVRDVISQVRLLFLTAAELELLAGTRGVAAAAEQVMGEFRMTALVVKRGPAGAVLVTRGGSSRHRACRCEVVDPTGAGDALAGAFIGRLVETRGLFDQTALVDALEWGLVAAAFTVEGIGVAGIRDVTRAQLQTRLDGYRLETHPREAGNT